MLTETEIATQRANLGNALRRAEMVRHGAYASGNARRIREAEGNVKRYANMLRRLQECR